jgi:hypothetical protein
MTTPVTTSSFLEEIRFRFHEARAKADCNAAIAPNSYGAGYDLGYSDALGELYELLTGDSPALPIHKQVSP